MAVSNIYAMPEQLRNSSLYFDPNSTNNMAEVMQELWTNELRREELIKEGQKLKEFYSMKSHKDRIESILKNLN